MKRALVFVTLLILGGGPEFADVELYLKDGQVLEGVDVYREEGNYYLRLADGEVIPIPEQLVERVGLSAEGPAEPPGEPEWPPSGLTPAEPQQLAGDPIRPATPSEQLEVFDNPSTFQKGVFNPNWHPESDWELRPTDPTRNDFAPSQWAESIIDPEWVPENAYPDDHTNFAPSKFQDNVIDPTWVPQDGFKK